MTLLDVTLTLLAILLVFILAGLAGAFPRPRDRKREEGDP